MGLIKNWNIYLDDIRQPPEGKWLRVRNYFNFVEIITDGGLPSFISFDHDLGEDVAKLRVKSGISKRKARAEKRLSKSGMDCAKWLVKYCLDNNLELPNFDCHSANPTGKENILSLLNSFKNRNKI